MIRRKMRRKKGISRRRKGREKTEGDNKEEREREGREEGRK